ncbi:MAG: hypothetical protein LUG50_11640 [Planctomycetaceae bacterium]|nr:hypothetical protein [Planctomycetaceae bacterium]
MDIALAVEKLLYGAVYSGSVVLNTPACWDAVLWLDARMEKPTWEELTATWEEMTTLSLDQIKEKKIAEVDTSTAALILKGFDYSIGDITFHFGYSVEDQGNFTKAALSAALAMIQGDTEFRQAWRGWHDGLPKTLLFTATEFIALAMYAGKTHQENCLASGWAITEQIRNAVTVEAVEAITDDRE